jgi:hypothetical protein
MPRGRLIYLRRSSHGSDGPLISIPQVGAAKKGTPLLPWGCLRYCKSIAPVSGGLVGA